MEGREDLAEFGVLSWIGIVISGVALIPYFGWGIFTLRLRYRYHEELTLVAEAGTLCGVVVFFVIELLLFRLTLSRMPIQFMFAILGLVVSGAALYGPLLVSFGSRLVVDIIAPGDRTPTNEPKFGPAEALERQGDSEGALHEYMVMARIFPREPSVLLRIANTLVRLSREEEAVEWFERALALMKSPEKSLQVANRLSSLYNRQLNRPADAVRVLEEYVERFPQSEYADNVHERLARLKQTDNEDHRECV